MFDDLSNLAKEFHHQFATLGEPFGEQAVAVNLHQMDELVLTVEANGQLLSNCFAKACLSGARWSM